MNKISRLTTSPEDPVAGKAFNDILAREADATPAQLGKRACDAFSPCCDPSTGCRSRATCYKNCGSIPGTGSLGCVAGMFRSHQCRFTLRYGHVIQPFFFFQLTA